MARDPRDRWELVVAGAADGNRHVLPLNDLREHVEQRSCWCEPRSETIRVGAGLRTAILVTHNALDGRELVERHGVQ